MAKSTTKKSDSKKTNYSDMQIQDLNKLAISTREEAVVLKRNMHMGDVQNIHAYSHKKRELARILTALNAATAKGKEQ